MIVPINPETGKPVQPDKGFRVNVSDLGATFNAWVHSKTSWLKMPLRYDMPPFSDYPPEGYRRTGELRKEAEVAIRSPNEVWGRFDNANKPILIYLKRFKDLATDEIYNIKVEIKDGEVFKFGETTMPEAYRVGVPGSN